VSGTSSELEGVSVEIPQGALKEDCTITIGEVTNPPALPENLKAIGKVIDYGPHGATFNTPVTIRVPYTLEDLYKSGVSDPAELEVWNYNRTTLAWEAVPVDRVEGGFLVYKLNHFSIYTAAKSVLTTPSSGITPISSDGATPIYGESGSGGCFIAILSKGGSSILTLVLLLSILLTIIYWGRRGRE
jgi:hypothetical protein